MKYLILLLTLFVVGILAAFINGQEETPTENLDNVKHMTVVDVVT